MADTYENEKILNIEEMAEVLGVPKSWIYQKTRIGQHMIPHMKVGRHLRFQKDAVLKHFGAQIGQPKTGTKL